MTSYNAIFERVYDDTNTGDEFLTSLTPSEQTAWKVLYDLYGRSGFDWWFDNIDNDTQDEIFETMRSLIEQGAQLEPDGRTL